MYDFFGLRKKQFANVILKRAAHAGIVINTLAKGEMPVTTNGELENKLRPFQHLLDQYKNIDNAHEINYVMIFFQFIFINLHILDRIAHQQNIDPDRRHKFVSAYEWKAIEAALASVITRFNIGKAEEFGSDIVDEFKRSIMFYAKFPNIINQDGQAMDGGLLWEFGKHISELSKREFSPVIILASVHLVMEDIEALDLQGIVRSNS